MRRSHPDKITKHTGYQVQAPRECCIAAYAQTFAIGDTEYGLVLQTYLLGESIRGVLG
jgi:hypothetical protein